MRKASGSKSRIEVFSLQIGVDKWRSAPFIYFDDCIASIKIKIICFRLYNKIVKTPPLQHWEATKWLSLWLFHHLGRSWSWPSLNGTGCFQVSEGPRVSAQSQSGWRVCVFQLATSWQCKAGVKRGGGKCLVWVWPPASSKEKLL